MKSNKRPNTLLNIYDTRTEPMAIDLAQCMSNEGSANFAVLFTSRWIRR